MIFHMSDTTCAANVAGTAYLVEQLSSHSALLGFMLLDL